MGKLKDLVREETSLANRLKYNSQRVRLAGIGLFNKVEHERRKLIRQLMLAGKGAGDESTLTGVVAVLGTGAIRTAREEFMRIFDELVETGRKASLPVVPRPLALPLASASAAKSAIEVVVQKSATRRASAPAASSAKKATAKPLSGGDASVDATRQTLKSLPADDARQLTLEALRLQVEEGDVKGRRPAQSKPAERALFDARKAVKGLSAAEASKQIDALLKNSNADATV